MKTLEEQRGEVRGAIIELFIVMSICLVISAILKDMFLFGISISIFMISGMALAVLFQNINNKIQELYTTVVR